MNIGDESVAKKPKLSESPSSPLEKHPEEIRELEENFSKMNTNVPLSNIEKKINIRELLKKTIRRRNENKQSC